MCLPDRGWSGSLVAPITGRGEPISRVLRPRVASAVGGGVAYWPLWHQLLETDIVQIERLQTAISFDICGVSRDELCDRFQTPHEREIRRRYQLGRKLLARLGAWPWVCFDGATPPANWRRTGDHPQAWAELQRWGEVNCPDLLPQLAA